MSDIPVARGKIVNVWRIVCPNPNCANETSIDVGVEIPRKLFCQRCHHYFMFEGAEDS